MHLVTFRRRIYSGIVGLEISKRGNYGKHQINQTKNKHMKTGTFLKCLTVAAGLLCATAFQVAAQPAGGGGGGGGGGGRGGRGGVLTQEQNQQMRDALPMDSAELTALTAKLTAAQKEAVDAALAKDATDASVRAKVEAVAKVQTDIAMLHFSKAVKPIAASVTDEQKTQIAAAPGATAATYGQLFGGGFGGGGRRGGGGGGGGGGGAPAGN
jgi:Spy/CpxP family protein refolding chaperone